MSHTLDDELLNNFMFDNSNSMRLSRQYFTVLQILRIARQWIDANASEWKQFEQGILQYISILGVLPGVTPGSWDHDLPLHLEKVTQLLSSQTRQLQERIDQKTEDVKSLRDGVYTKPLPSCRSRLLRLLVSWRTNQVP